MMNRRWIAWLLALACLLLAGCAAADTQDTPAGDTAGSDWRTWGWVNGSGTLTLDGETAEVLVCIFTDSADFYYDDDQQTLRASAAYPAEIPDAREAYQSITLDDLNGDGSSDVQLHFVHADGAAETLVWYWDAAGQYVFQSAQAETE